MILLLTIEAITALAKATAAKTTITTIINL